MWPARLDSNQRCMRIHFSCPCRCVQHFATSRLQFMISLLKSGNPDGTLFPCFPFAIRNTNVLPCGRYTLLRLDFQILIIMVIVNENRFQVASDVFGYLAIRPRLLFGQLRFRRYSDSAESHVSNLVTVSRSGVGGNRTRSHCAPL